MNATTMLFLLEGPAVLGTVAPRSLPGPLGAGLRGGVIQRRARLATGLTSEALWLLLEGTVEDLGLRVDHAA